MSAVGISARLDERMHTVAHPQLPKKPRLCRRFHYGSDFIAVAALLVADPGVKCHFVPLYVCVCVCVYCTCILLSKINLHVNVTSNFLMNIGSSLKKKTQRKGSFNAP